MSEKPSELDPEQEKYAYALTRRLFKYTTIGTILFSITIVAFWIFFV